MNVDLPSELESYLRDSVARGEFASEGELLADALRLHRERAGRLRDLRRDIAEAIDSLDRGEGRVIANEDEHRAFFAEIETRALERLRRGMAG